MNDKILIGFMLVFSALGIVFLGTALTGNIISESCCFGPNCNAENICDSANPNLESPSKISDTHLYLGIVMLISAVALLITMFEIRTKSD